MIRWGVKFFSWVCADILRLDSEIRLERFYFWIDVCDELLTLNNLDSISAIISAFNEPFILRLKNTWNRISPNSKLKFESFTNLFSPIRNYSNYREYFSKQKFKPKIPAFIILWNEIEELKKTNRWNNT